MTFEVWADCAGCDLKWIDTRGSHRVHVNGTHTVLVEVPEDWPVYASVCRETDSLPSAAVWLKRDGLPWGFAACMPHMDYCASVEH